MDEKFLALKNDGKQRWTIIVIISHSFHIYLPITFSRLNNHANGVQRIQSSSSDTIWATIQKTRTSYFLQTPWSSPISSQVLPKIEKNFTLLRYLMFAEKNTRISYWHEAFLSWSPPLVFSFNSNDIQEYILMRLTFHPRALISSTQQIISRHSVTTISNRQTIINQFSSFAPVQLKRRNQFIVSSVSISVSVAERTIIRHSTPSWLRNSSKTASAIGPPPS